MPVCSCRKIQLLLQLKQSGVTQIALRGLCELTSVKLFLPLPYAQAHLLVKMKAKESEIGQYAGRLMKHILEQREGGKTHTKVSASVILGDGNHLRVAGLFPFSWSPPSMLASLSHPTEHACCTQQMSFSASHL